MNVQVGPVDAAMLGVLLVSVIVGLWRGLVFEMLGIIGWVAAWFCAQWFAPVVAPYLPVGRPGSGINLGASYVLVFVGVLIVWALASRLVRMLVRATPLSAFDRVLGAGFGFARGLIVLLALATVVALTPLAASPAWRASDGAAWLHAVLRGLAPILPGPIARHLPA